MCGSTARRSGTTAGSGWSSQRLLFGGTYLRGFLPQRFPNLLELVFLSPPLLQSSKQQDLPIPPPKLVDLWRIEGGDLDPHFHRAVSPLSEGNPFDLVLEVPFVVFFVVLPLSSPISISCLWWDLRVKDLSTCALAIASLHRFVLSTRIRGS